VTTDILFPVADPIQGQDRLGFAAFLALALHSLVIFGIGFDFLKPQPATRALEVTLAQQPTDDAIKDAAYMAQANQEGSGNITDEQTKITTDKLSDYTAEVLRDTQPLMVPQVEQAAQNRSERTITSSQGNRRIRQQSVEDGEQESLNTEKEILPTRLKEFSSLQAQLDIQKQAYNKLPNILRMTSARTQAAEHAAYLKYWVDKIEQVGNFHYPDEARQRKLYGELSLAVTVLPDGSVESVELLKVSGQPVLDQAAVETVRMASPFAPFPRDMIHWDKIEIIQTWRFLPGDHLRTR
tara:strand:- start:7292 stop:8179 length:888 start_codon:yes stop_codon:yes gene_type:complete